MIPLRDIAPPRRSCPLIDRDNSPRCKAPLSSQSDQRRVTLHFRIQEDSGVSFPGRSASEFAERSTAFNLSFFCIHGPLSGYIHRYPNIQEMAPDLNSLPPSPYSPRRIASMSSRRAGNIMAPPPAPISPPAQSPTIMSSEPMANMTSGDNTGVGVGPGMRAHILLIHLEAII